MDMKKEFNIASKRDAEQTRLAEDQERLRRIEQIRDAGEREHHRQAMALRDEKLKIEKERAEREERGIVQREVQKKLAEKHELHLTMKKAEGLSPEKKREMIERTVSHNVRITHGTELDQHREECRQTMNKELDKGIQESLDRQAQKERENENKSLKRPWESNARDQQSERPWESGLSKGRGIERTRDR